MKNLILIFSIALLFASCEKEKQECPGATEKTFAITGFTKVNAGDAHHVTISKGSEFSIKANGCASDLNDLELTLQSNHILNIKYKNSRNDRYRVDFYHHHAVAGISKLIRCFKRKYQRFWRSEYSDQNSFVRGLRVYGIRNRHQCFI